MPDTAVQLHDVPVRASPTKPRAPSTAASDHADRTATQTEAGDAKDSTEHSREADAPTVGVSRSVQQGTTHAHSAPQMQGLEAFSSQVFFDEEPPPMSPFHDSKSKTGVSRHRAAASRVTTVASLYPHTMPAAAANGAEQPAASKQLGWAGRVLSKAAGYVRARIQQQCATFGDLGLCYLAFPSSMPRQMSSYTLTQLGEDKGAPLVTVKAGQDIELPTRSRAHWLPADWVAAFVMLAHTLATNSSTQQSTVRNACGLKHQTTALLR